LKSCDEINFGATNCIYDLYWPPVFDSNSNLENDYFYPDGRAIWCEVQFGENKGHVYPAT